MRSSRLKGFYKLRRGERLDLLREFSDLPVEQARLLSQDGALPFDTADLFIENAIGSFPLPMGMATSFKVNDKDYVVPMAVEESSVIAAASNAARWIYESGGFQAEAVSALMIGQIQVLDVEVSRMPSVLTRILEHKEELLQIANETHPRLLMRGGGAKEIEVRAFPDAEIPFLVVHVLLDTRDAMGANLVNTVCEKLGPHIQRLSEGRVGLKILSNLADRKTFRSRCKVKAEFLALKDAKISLSGEEVARRIYEAYVFADNDPYRAATHNKGVMNGIDPVVIATGNDWRAVEAGAHAYAAQTGRYRSLTKWKIGADGMLHGEIEIPLQLGTVGGVTRLHPLAKTALQILGSPSSEELGLVIASAGLASNLAALRALVSIGIQRGHMKLHAKNLALAAGSKGPEVEAVANQLVLKEKLSLTAAEEILALLRQPPSLGESNDALGAISPG